MSFMRYLSPAMDQYASFATSPFTFPSQTNSTPSMFMDSLSWVDQTYIQKHANENPADLRAMYHPNLRLYENVHAPDKNTSERTRTYDAMMAFGWRFGRKALLSFAVYLLTFLPYVGRFVLPAASFYTFNKAVGTPAAVVIFSSGVFVPKKYLVMFLQSYFSSRSLMRDLVRPLSTLPILQSKCMLILTTSSSTPTSPASATPKTKRRNGSTSAKASSTASPSPSSS